VAAYHRGAPYASGTVEPRAEETPDELEGALARWVEAGLIGADQAAAIRRHEAGGAGPVRRLPPAAEAVADLGIVLGVAAAAVLWGNLAGRGAHTARLGLSAGVALLLLVAGAVLRRSDEPGLGRISSLLWLLASLGIGVAVFDTYAASTGSASDLPTVVTLGAGVPMAMVGWVTHVLDRRAMTMVGAFLGTITTGVGLVVWAFEDASADVSATAMAGVLALIGIVWIGATLVGRLRPTREAGVLGVLPILIAPVFLLDRSIDWALLVGVVASAALMGIGVRLPGWLAMIVSGVALFGYLTTTLVHYFEDSLGVPLVLLIAAALMIAVAATVVRLRRPTK
jgi:hypothetical protein